MVLSADGSKGGKGMAHVGKAHDVTVYATLEKSNRESVEAQLDERQRRLLESACLYHALVNPGRQLTIKVYVGTEQQYPRLTDASTLTGTITEGMESLGEFRIDSTWKSQTPFDPHYLGGDGRLVVDTGVRSILLTPSTATDESVQSHWAKSKEVRLYEYLEQRSPATLDRIRDVVWNRQLRAASKPIPRRQYTKELARLRRVIKRPIAIPQLAGAAAVDSPPAILIGMHWLQPGGAERWGIETVQLAREAGLVPIVITDRESQQPWITRSELKGALVLTLTHPLLSRTGDEPLLRALLELFDVKGVLLHHCQWLYDRLPWLKANRPELKVLDSLHIVEYSGGFPATSIHHDNYIDIHHVISPQLQRWMTETHGVVSKKTVLAPLVGLTTAQAVAPFKPRGADPVFTICFVGRFTRQKRPEAFLELVAALRSAEVPFKAIMHGGGELDSVVATIVRSRRLQDVVEIRSGEVPVSETLAESDLLVVTSGNEGLTLTTIEAIAAGVPVISTDVGSQSTLVPNSGLMSRLTPRMVTRAVSLITQLNAHEELREQLWKLERVKADHLAQLQSASEWAREELASWVR